MKVEQRNAQKNWNARARTQWRLLSNVIQPRSFEHVHQTFEVVGEGPKDSEVKVTLTPDELVKLVDFVLRAQAHPGVTQPPVHLWRQLKTLVDPYFEPKEAVR